MSAADVGWQDSERWLRTRESIREAARLIRNCYSVPAREAERMLYDNRGDLEMTLDQIGDS